jgi:hypothetical protein
MAGTPAGTEGRRFGYPLLAMKRGGFARKVYVPAPTPELKPVVNCRGVIHRVSDEVVAVPKAVILRSEAYRRWVAELPCICCGIEGYTQCAHSNLAIHGKGDHLKASDENTFPLCIPHGDHQGCHAPFDSGLEYTKDERNALCVLWVELTQAKAKAAGWKFGDLGITR